MRLVLAAVPSLLAVAMTSTGDSDLSTGNGTGKGKGGSRIRNAPTPGTLTDRAGLGVSTIEAMIGRIVAGCEPHSRWL